MNGLQKNFTFLSQIIGIAVKDSVTGKKIGKVVDLAAGLREMYPRVTGLIVRKKMGRTKAYVAWKDVKRLQECKDVFIENIPAVFEREVRLPENEILLGETFWDKQIVDIAGSKVVRVNDLHLLREELNLWVVHVDIGMTGLMRRLGCAGFLEYLLSLFFSYELKDRLVSWKFVQPISSPVGADALSLKVHQSRLAELHPADLAEIIIDLGTDERIVILKSLDDVTAAHTFQELPLKVRVQIAELLDSDHLVNVIREMAMDEVVDLLAKLSRKKVNALSRRLPQEKVVRIMELLKLSKREAGSLMNTEFMTAKHHMSVGMILEKVKAESKNKELIYYIYILDDQETLAGVVTLRQLLTTAAEKIASDFMHRRIVKVRVDTDVKDVAEIFSKYNFVAVPVVDEHNKVQGIITMKDAFESAFDEVREEAEEPK